LLPSDKIAQVDATMSQIKVLQKIIEVLVPVKSAIDHAKETQERSGLAPTSRRENPELSARSRRDQEQFRKSV
jgi:hypothetical protein